MHDDGVFISIVCPDPRALKPIEEDGPVWRPLFPEAVAMLNKACAAEGLLSAPLFQQASSTGTSVWSSAWSSVWSSVWSSEIARHPRMIGVCRCRATRGP